MYCRDRQEPNIITMHVRMLDSTAQLQQEALGVLGVNFIHAALTKGSDTNSIINSLLDDLSRSRIEVTPGRSSLLAMPDSGIVTSCIR